MQARVDGFVTDALVCTSYAGIDQLAPLHSPDYRVQSDYGKLILTIKKWIMIMEMGTRSRQIGDKSAALLPGFGM